MELVVSDAHQGLKDDISTVFTVDSWQRCRTHFMTNLLTCVPRRARPWLASMFRAIHQKPSLEEAHTQLERVINQLREGLNREIRRRTDLVGILCNQPLVAWLGLS